MIRQGEDTVELADRRGIPVKGRRFRDNDKSATHGKYRPDYEMLDLPMKTVMWINPGVVKVAEGYNAQPTTIRQG